MGYFPAPFLLGERTLYRGVELRGGNHGFLRSFEFDAPTFDPGTSSLTYRVPADRIPEGAYPLKVSLALTYRLLPDGVSIEFIFENEEPELDAHVSFGLHPGFTLSSLAGADILLPAGIYRRLWAPGNFLDGRVDVISHPGGPMPFDKGALPDSYILDLAAVPARIFTLRDVAAGTSVILDFSATPYCTLWSDGGPMICIEPCWGLPDSNPAEAFRAEGWHPGDFAARRASGRLFDPRGPGGSMNRLPQLGGTARFTGGGHVWIYRAVCARNGGFRTSCVRRIWGASELGEGGKPRGITTRKLKTTFQVRLAGAH